MAIFPHGPPYPGEEYVEGNKKGTLNAYRYRKMYGMRAMCKLLPCWSDSAFSGETKSEEKKIKD